MKQCLVLDIGSAHTKAALFEKEKEWTLIAAGEAMTTTVQPYDDAMIGIREALKEIEKYSGRSLWQDGVKNVDTVVIQSSAGGGLQMVVAGIVETMTTESARRAALGAGAIVTEVISGGTSIKQPERLHKLQQTRPDIILLAGGTEGGNEDQVVGLAETIHSAHVQARLGDDLVPVVYAGNSAIRDSIKRYLGGGIPLYIADNIRPSLEDEQVDNVNEIIQKIYLEKVAARVPGFQNINQLGTTTVYPTVRNLSQLIRIYAEHLDRNIMLFDIGSFTSDVYSSIEYVRRAYKRPMNDERTINVNIGTRRERKSYISISADLGLAHSAARLVRKTGIKQILRWLPAKTEAEAIHNYSFNLMLNPQYNNKELQSRFTKAFATECLRLALAEHQEIAGRLHGVGIVRNMQEAFDQVNYNEGTVAERLIIDDMIITGNYFSINRNPQELIQMIIDGLEPEGVTNIYVDQNDCLSRIAGLPDATPENLQDFWEENIQKLVTVIAPVGSGRVNRRLAEVVVNIEGQKPQYYRIQTGQMGLIKLPEGTEVKLTITPDTQIDVGWGKGVAGDCSFRSAKHGIILDGRLRPLQKISEKRIKKWYDPVWKAIGEGARQ